MGDYLFLYQEDRAQNQFGYLTGNLNLDRKQVILFKNNLKENNLLAKKYRFLYKHVVYPCKAVAFSDIFKKYDVHIMPIFSKEHECENVIYPYLKAEHYHPDDTHTNHIGNLKVVCDLMKELNGIDLPEPLFAEAKIKGDLNSMLDEDREIPTKKIFAGFNGCINDKVERFSLDKHLKGNSGHIDFHYNPYALYNSRIVLFGDSFFKNSLNIFNKIFSEVIYFRVPFIYEDVIKCLSPDVVLTGNAERYLVDVPDSSIPTPYGINFLSKTLVNPLSESEYKILCVLFSGRYSDEFKKNYSNRYEKNGVRS